MGRKRKQGAGDVEAVTAAAASTSRSSRRTRRKPNSGDDEIANAIASGSSPADFSAASASTTGPSSELRPLPNPGVTIENPSKASQERMTTTSRQQDADEGSAADAVASTSAIANSGASNEEHPLLNHVVLSSLFKICPPDVLVTCRLVCKTWRDVSLRPWCSSSTINCNYSCQFNNFYLGRRLPYFNTPPVGLTKLDEFLDLWELPQSGMSRYKQFRLVYWQFNDQVRATSRLMTRNRIPVTRFLQLVGPSITSLELFGVSFKNFQEFQQVIFRCCPNLETLALRQIMFPRNSYSRKPYTKLAPHLHLKTLSFDHKRDPGLVFWEALLTNCPALTAINVVQDFYDGLYGFMKILNALRNIRENHPNKLRLDHFDVLPTLVLPHSRHYGFYVREVIDLIRELNLPLQSVGMRLVGCDPDMIKNVVTFHQSSLKKIHAVKVKATDVLDPAIFPCAFPFGVELNNLRELAIDAAFCHNLDFLKSTPALMSLRVLDRNFNDKSALCKNSYVLPPVETRIVANTCKGIMVDVKLLKLEELYLGYVVSNKDLNNLMDWFPNVKELFMFLTDEQFTVVCENWRDLRYLHNFGEDLTDEGITGMTFQEGEVEGDDIPIGPLRPNITLLKALRTFRMAVNMSKLTDISAFHGFLKLPYLQTLDIASVNNRFGTGAEKLLKENVPHCILEEPEVS